MDDARDDGRQIDELLTFEFSDGDVLTLLGSDPPYGRVVEDDLVSVTYENSDSENFKLVVSDEDVSLEIDEVASEELLEYADHLSTDILHLLDLLSAG